MAHFALELSSPEGKDNLGHKTTIKYCSATFELLYSTSALAMPENDEHILVVLLFEVDVMYNDTSELTTSTSQYTENARVTIESCSSTMDVRHDVPERRWRVSRNDTVWIFCFGLQLDFINSPHWRALFRISFSLFE